MEALTAWEWGFLLLRVTTAACCLLAAMAVFRYGVERARLRRRPPGMGWLYRLGTMLFLLVLAGLTLSEGWRQAMARAGQPIALLDWFWLFTDLVVPLALVQLLRALRQRDALEAQLHEAARHDPLTGLPNRAGFAEAAALALAQAGRAGAPVAAAMLDLDRFKRINDAHGHAAGDAVLRGATAALTGALRPGDVLGRMGGEEFAVILPGLDATAALPVVERLRAAVEAAVPHPAGGGERVTLSAGVATLPGLDAPGLEAALASADAALYAAKAAGRNRALPAAA